MPGICHLTSRLLYNNSLQSLYPLISAAIFSLTQQMTAKSFCYPSDGKMILIYVSIEAKHGSETQDLSICQKLCVSV